MVTRKEENPNFCVHLFVFNSKRKSFFFSLYKNNLRLVYPSKMNNELYTTREINLLYR
jgi:hypothetical protein